MTDKPDLYTLAAKIDPPAFGYGEQRPWSAYVTLAEQQAAIEHFARRRREAMEKARRNNDDEQDGA